MRSRDAVRRLLSVSGELGLARAFIVGDLDFDGDIFEVLALLHAGSPSLVRHDSRLPWQAIRAAYRLGAVGGPVGASTGGGGTPGPLYRATATRRWCDTHYDVSNDFYAMVSGLQ